MSFASGSGDTERNNKSTVVFDEAPDESSGSRPALAFVNTTGPIVKNAQVQRSIRNFVMRSYGRARRRGDKEKRVEKPVAIAPVPALPKLTSVANPSLEYVRDVELVKAAKNMYCAFPGCTEPMAGTGSSASTNEGGPSICNKHRSMTSSGSTQISRFSTVRIDPFIPYPIPLTPRIRQLMDHVFTDTPNRSIKFYRDTIFPTALIGSITFHQVLANLALYLRHAKPLESAEQYEMREEMAHQAKVFQLVNEKIAKQEATSDDVICAVAALACQSHVARDMRMFHMHMNGLKAIITKRGGIQTIDSNAVMRHSIYWLDVNGNSTEDRAPSYPIPIHLVPFRPIFSPTITLPSGALHISTTWSALYPSSRPLLDIFDDTARFGIHLAAEEARTAGHIYTDVVHSGNLIIGLVHRLLSTRSPVDASRPETLFAEATRLALLLFLAEIRRRFGLHPIDSRVHVQKLQDVLAGDEADWSALEPLRLWLLGMAVLDAWEDPELGWLVGEWTRQAFSGGVTTVGQAERLFRKVMWIDTVHGTLFRDRQERFFGKGPVLAPKGLS